jgi:heavy metal sensor kinase
MKAVVARIPIRWRLALAFAVAMAAVLALTGAVVYQRLGSSLDRAIDDGLRTRAAAVAALVEEQQAAGPGRTIVVAGRGEGVDQVLDERGRVVASSAPVRAPLLQPGELPRALAGSILVDRGSLAGTDERVRLLAVPVSTRKAKVVVVVATSLENRDDALSGLLLAFLIGGPLALVLASTAGYLVAAFALRPVESMRRTAAAITAADTSGRLPVPPAQDEVRRLGETLNAMLERLDAALERERRFVSDASHELRTPLGLLRTELELALRRERTEAELRAALVSASEETERLALLAEDLLVFARSDRGSLPLRVEKLRADDVLEGVRRRFASRAGERGRDLTVRAPRDLELAADDVRLEQALGNLVDNALRHGGGSIVLDARARDGFVELHVLDEGAGLAEDFLPRAFERFARADEARTGPGSGLGLAIVRTIARAHGGDAHAATRPGGGADVWLDLPVNRSG